MHVGVAAALDEADIDTDPLLFSLCFDCGVTEDFKMYMAFACVKINIIENTNDVMFYFTFFKSTLLLRRKIAFTNANSSKLVKMNRQQTTNHTSDILM